MAPISLPPITSNSGRPVRPLAIWAVDLFAADLRLQREAAIAIHALQRRFPLQIQPIYLSTPAPRQPAFHEWAQARLNELASGARIPPSALLPIEIVEVIERSINSRVTALLEFAHQHRAHWIVLSTRATHGPKRWFLGSFADTISLRSDIPLFIVNPSWSETSEFEEILFPTDFSLRSRQAYSKVLRFAAQARLKVSVFHKYGSDIGPAWDFNLVPSPPLSQEDYNDELAEIRRELERWREEGRAAGVETLVEIDAETGSVVESILRRAELASCILAMTARSTRVEAIMLGSVTRQLVRVSTAPVWILCEPKSVPKGMPRNMKDERAAA